MKGIRETHAGVGCPLEFVTGPWRGQGMLYAAVPDECCNGPEELNSGFDGHWKGRQMLIRAATA